MNNSERYNAVLHYKEYDHLPVIHFGYWNELLDKWATEGHISPAQAAGWGDGNQVCRELDTKLGFDFNFESFYAPQNFLLPYFEEKIVKRFEDGSMHIRDSHGVTHLEIPGAYVQKQITFSWTESRGKNTTCHACNGRKSDSPQIWLMMLKFSTILPITLPDFMWAVSSAGSGI